MMRFTRTRLLLGFAALLAWAQFRESGDPKLSAHLTLEAEPRMPVRVYLFKEGRPFRLSPVDAMLPLRIDLLYRERMWVRSADPTTLEVTATDQSHFFLLKGRGEYELPQGKYRVEAYRGLFYVPLSIEFELKAGESRRIALPMKNWLGAESREWLSGDDHIHLVRAKQDDPIFLAWLQAEDLSVALFLQLQRQMDAAVQYGFGAEAEAKASGYSIRSGHESRSDLFGHINLLGGREPIRPLSVGGVYSNAPEGFPYPSFLFRKGRAVGALTGYAHFDGGAHFGEGAPPRMRDAKNHSTLLMDLALGNIDFIEVFQAGYLNDERWYELLNAGFEIRGIAGSDFPAAFGGRGLKGRFIPLLGPERTLVRAKAGASAYEAWAKGLRTGEVIVTNGPVVRLQMEGGKVVVSAQFFRPLTRLEVIADGHVIAAKEGDGSATQLTGVFAVPESTVWVAARVTAATEEDEPAIRAHTNPQFLRHQVANRAERTDLADDFAKEIDFSKTQPRLLDQKEQRQMFFREADAALSKLRQ